MPTAITVDVTSQPDSAVYKTSRLVDAINYGAAYDDESLHPVMEAVMDWYHNLPATWDQNPEQRLGELIDIIERTPTETGATLSVEQRPGHIDITAA